MLAIPETPMEQVNASVLQRVNETYHRVFHPEPCTYISKILSLVLKCVSIVVGWKRESLEWNLWSKRYNYCIFTLTITVFLCLILSEFATSVGTTKSQAKRDRLFARIGLSNFVSALMSSRVMLRCIVRTSLCYFGYTWIPTTPGNPRIAILTTLKTQIDPHLLRRTTHEFQ